MCHLVRPRWSLGVRLSAVLLLLVWAALVVPGARAAVPTPEQDPFYTYQGSTPLASIAPGTVLKTRTLPYHVAGIALPVNAVQLLYRSTGQLGQPTVNVTSVLLPPLRFGPPKVLSYQSFYDSLNRDDEPSYAISGGLTLGGLIPTVESALIVPALLAGRRRRGPRHRGPERRLRRRPRVRHEHARLAARGAQLAGHRPGGAAEDRAARLLRRRDRHRVGGRAGPVLRAGHQPRIVGAAMGGVLVDPAHNLHYVDGSSIWAGVIPMALIGISRAFQHRPHAVPERLRLQLVSKLQNASITKVLGAYPGLTWSSSPSRSTRRRRASRSTCRSPTS